MVYSQIWLNLPRDDQSHLFYIAPMDDRHFSCKQKNSRKNHCSARPQNDVVFIWSHILTECLSVRRCYCEYFFFGGGGGGGTSWNISYLNCCWFELAIKEQTHYAISRLRKLLLGFNEVAFCVSVCVLFHFYFLSLLLCFLRS